MRPHSALAWLFVLLAGRATAAPPACEFQRVPAGAQKLSAWIDKSNWLAVENHRLTLQAAEVFMPTWRRAASTNAHATTTRQISIDSFQTIDPLDETPRDLGFLLDSRLQADGLLVLRNGQPIVERFRNGLLPDKPRLLLEASRPLLNLLGAISVSQGKLSGDKSVSRYLPGLSANTGLRKMSVQRLIEGQEGYDWGAEELTSWRQAGGWSQQSGGSGLRAWLTQAGRWEKPLVERKPSAMRGGPEDDLLAWLLAESNATPLSRLFCELLLSRAQPAHSTVWVSDEQGVELASGLGLSLRDFAQLGQLLIEARSSRSRAKVPAWFIETLLASTGLRTGEIPGLSKGSEYRDGFLHLGGAPNRVALLGSHGSSLYIDFDKRLVVALYATHPGGNTPATLALLERIWTATEQVVMRSDKRK